MNKPHSNPIDLATEELGFQLELAINPTAPLSLIGDFMEVVRHTLDLEEDERPMEVRLLAVERAYDRIHGAGFHVSFDHEHPKGSPYAIEMASLLPGVRPA